MRMDTPSILKPSTHETYTTRRKAHCPFLSFPAEVRNQVYKCLFVNKKETYGIPYGWLAQTAACRSSSPFRFTDDDLSRLIKHENRCTSPCSYLGGLQLQLFQANKQIYYEATTIFWGSNYFFIGIGALVSPREMIRAISFQYSKETHTDADVASNQFLHNYRNMHPNIPDHILRLIRSAAISIAAFTYCPNINQIPDEREPDVYEATLHDVRLLANQLMPDGQKAHNLQLLQVQYDVLYPYDKNVEPALEARTLIPGHLEPAPRENLLEPLGLIYGVQRIDIGGLGTNRSFKKKLENALTGDKVILREVFRDQEKSEEVEQQDGGYERSTERNKEVQRPLESWANARYIWLENR